MKHGLPENIEELTMQVILSDAKMYLIELVDRPAIQNNTDIIDKWLSDNVNWLPLEISLIDASAKITVAGHFTHYSSISKGRLLLMKYRKHRKLPNNSLTSSFTTSQGS